MIGRVYNFARIRQVADTHRDRFPPNLQNTRALKEYILALWIIASSSVQWHMARLEQTDVYT